MLKPLGDRIVLRVTEEAEKTVGGLVLASSAQDKPQTAEVLAVGQGTRTLNGDIIPVAVEVGDTVVFEKFAGTQVKLDDDTVLVVRESDILGILN